MAHFPGSIGIDIGTTTCCVGLFTEGRLHVIPTPTGARRSSSAATFDWRDGPIVSRDTPVAVNTVHYGTKRVLGRRFGDPRTQCELKWCPFPVQDNVTADRLTFQVPWYGEDKWVIAEEALALVLVALREAAEEYIHAHVDHVVIAVPATFGVLQRQATMAAALMAGLLVTRLVGAPTAAALHVVHRPDRPGERHVVVIDIGGGYTDVALLCLDDEMLEVKAVAGDVVGGLDFDRRVAAYVAAKFNLHTGEDVWSDHTAVRRLLAACEKAKCTLSNHLEAVVEVESLTPGFDCRQLVTRQQFEALVGDLLRSLVAPCEEVTRGITTVDEVVLLGGSSHIPLLRETIMTAKLFPGVQCTVPADMDIAVMGGAAIVAGFLAGHLSECPLFLEVVPHALHVTTCDVTECIVTGKTAVPMQRVIRMPTTEETQCRMEFQVREGGRVPIEANEVICRGDVLGLMPSVKPNVNSTFHVNANGILEVSVIDRTYGRSSPMITTALNWGGLSRAEGVKKAEEMEDRRSTPPAGP